MTAQELAMKFMEDEKREQELDALLFQLTARRNEVVGVRTQEATEEFNEVVSRYGSAYREWNMLCESKGQRLQDIGSAYVEEACSTT